MDRRERTRRSTAAARRGGHVTFCHPRAEQLVGQLATANIVTDYRTPDRFRFGLSPLTTRFTDVWSAVAASRDIIGRQGQGGR